jgi:ubiquinone/menaquinone biosynthesis C-methylase UbiE
MEVVIMREPESGAIEAVRGWWDANPCDTELVSSERYSLKYFEELEESKYTDQAFIHSFAQFTRYHGKRVLEVGHGPGTDFIQWLRAGAVLTGIDLTEEAHEHVKQRIAAYGLPQPDGLEIGSAEDLPFESNSFDLGYSFGVLHHTEATETALTELVRVIKPGGDFKVMLYNRHSVYVINQWIKHALIKGKPFQRVSEVVANHIESPGTKAYTRRELMGMLRRLPLREIQIHTTVTSADRLSARAFPPLNLLNRTVLQLTGSRMGFFHNISAKKDAE